MSWGVALMWGTSSSPSSSYLRSQGGWAVVYPAYDASETTSQNSQQHAEEKLVSQKSFRTRFT